MSHFGFISKYKILSFFICSLKHQAKKFYFKGLNIIGLMELLVNVL